MRKVFVAVFVGAMLGSLFGLARLDAQSGAQVVIPGSQYRTSPPTYANGTYGSFQIDTNGKLLVAGGITNQAAAGAPGAQVNIVPTMVGQVNTAALAALTDQSWQLLSLDNTGAVRTRLSTNPTVLGSLTNDNAAPTATNIGALVALSNTNAPTLTTGRTELLSVDTSGALRTISPFLNNNITTLTTTTVKSGSGLLHAIVINTKGTTASTATIFDNTVGSGTKIGTLDTTAATGTLLYDTVFATGLTIVTATGVAPDITVVYK